MRRGYEPKTIGGLAGTIIFVGGFMLLSVLEMMNGYVFILLSVVTWAVTKGVNAADKATIKQKE